MRNKSLKAMSRGILLFLVVMIIAVPLLWIYISLPTASYAVQNLEYDSSNVLEDLMSSEVIQNGQSKPFNLSDYPKNALARSPKLINVVEYCYSARKAVRSHYGLYLYIYNPQLINFDDMSVQNKVQLAVTYDEEGKPEEYEKFDLQFCNRSVMAGTERLFYKYKVVDKKSADGKYVVDRVKGSERRYDISGFELLTKGESNAKDYTVGGTYKYSGYAKGCGADPEAESDLKCKVTDLETVELDVRHANYRSKSLSALGVGHQNELNSVFFSVPSEIIKEYGSLQKVKAEWYEYRTAPIVVVSDTDTYNTAYPFIGKKLTANASGDKFNFYDNACRTSFVAIEGNYTNSSIFGFNVNFNSVTLPYLFYTGNSSILAKDYILSSKRILDYIENYDKSYYNGKIEKGYSADLFLSDLDSISKEKGRKRGYNVFDIDAGEKYNLISYDSTHSWWDKFVDFGLFGKPNTSGDNGCYAIQEIKDSDLIESNSVISTNLLVNEEYVDELKTYQLQNKSKNTTFLFRFAQSDYWAYPLLILTPNSSNGIGITGRVDEKHGYVAQENVFFDFDIIQLTFNKDGVYTVIPVVSSPIDIVNDITPPFEKPDWLEWIKRILAIIVLIVILIVLAPVLPYVLKFVVWVITLPFRAIVWLVKSLKKKQ